MKEYKVAVKCQCYNHVSYVKNTLDGLSSQITNFKYVAVIIDDASTDGSQDVINQYLENSFDVIYSCDKKCCEKEDARIIFSNHKKNSNFYLVVILLKYNFYQLGKSKSHIISEWIENAEYWAMCECDDYWIYDKKLQEEVDFLDNNKEYGLVYTDFDIINYDTGEYISAVFKNRVKPTINSFEQHLINAAYIAPMSWVCRIPHKDLIKSYNGPSSVDGTFIIALEVFLRSKVHYIDKVTCVYGRHVGSATKQSSISKQYKYAHGVYSTQRYYLDKYSLRNKYPTCLDTFLNAYYCFIIGNGIEEDYSEVQSFFHRKAKSSIKFRLMEIMMKSECTFPMLQSICRLRIKNK